MDNNRNTPAKANLMKKEIGRFVLYKELSKYYTADQIDQILVDIATHGTIDLNRYVKKTEVDSALSPTSEMPVQNKVIYEKLMDYYNKEQIDEMLSQGGHIVDPQPTKDSPNAVSSGGVYDVTNGTLKTRYIPFDLRGESIIFLSDEDMTELFGPATMVGGQSMFDLTVGQYQHIYRVTNSKSEVFEIPAAYHNANGARKIVGINGNLTIELSFTITNGVYINAAIKKQETSIPGISYEEEQDLTAAQRRTAQQNIGLEKDVAGGVAGLDESGKIDSAQMPITVVQTENGKVPASVLPAYVDDVIEGYYGSPAVPDFSPSSSYSAGDIVGHNGKIYRFVIDHTAGDWNPRQAEEVIPFPATGETGKVYSDIIANTTYRWSGSTYSQIKGDLSLGETSETAFAGNRGKALEQQMPQKQDIIQDLSAIRNGSSKGATSVQYEQQQNLTDVQKVRALNNIYGKAYAPEQHSGLGKVFLDKNNGVLTQDMISQANTVYVIMYDYTLNDDITIPENCILEFDGGSLANGILKGDGFIIDSDTYCLNNIQFSGDCTLNLIGELVWFVKAYPKNANDTSIDNTEEIQSCIDCGLHSIKFPIDKYLHITETIVVSKPINIVTDYGLTQSGSFSDIMQLETRPCIFSKNIVTLFRYNVSKWEDTHVGFYSIFIGHILLYVDVDYDSSEDDNTPVIDIATDGADLWGVYIHASIKSQLRRYGYTFGGTIQYDYFNSHTGIRLSAVDGYITYVNIYGSIYGTYYGIKTIMGSGRNWLTNLVIHGDTYCAIGIEDAPSMTIVYGSHQTCILHSEQTYRTDAYFSSSRALYVYGYVWDCGTKSTRSDFRNVYLPVRFTRNGAEIDDMNPMVFTNNVFGRERNRFNKYPQSIIKISSPMDDDVSAYSNFLEHLLRNGSIASNGAITDLSYTLDNTDIYTSASLYNSDNLFNTKCLFGVREPNRTNNAYIILDTSTHTIKVSFTLDLSKFAIVAELFLFYRNSNPTAVTSIEVIDITNNDNVIYTASNLGYNYYNGEHLRVNLTPYNNGVTINSKIKINITLSYSSNNATQFLLPSIIIPYKCGIDKNISVPTANLPVINNQHRIGVAPYDTTRRMPLFWNGYSYTNALGVPISQESGTTANRPSAFMRNGLWYYDTNIEFPILYRSGSWCNSDGITITNMTKCKGYASDRNAMLSNLSRSQYGLRFYDRGLKKWVALDDSETNLSFREPDGAIAGVARSGSTASRPLGSSIYIGFQYFDTSITPARPIYAKAISEDTVTWVDATGTSV